MTPKAGDVVLVDKGRVTQDPPGKVRTGSYPSFKWVDCPECSGAGCSRCGKTHRTKGVTYVWLGCDACGGISLIRSTPPDQARIGDPDYRKTRGRPCRMTPGCSGRHLVTDPGGRL